MNENDINRALLIILDGVGVGPNSENNGWALAHTPNIDLLLNDYPSTTIQASGQMKQMIVLMVLWFLMTCHQ